MCLPGLLIPSKSEYNCFSSSALWVGQSSARLFNFYVSVLYKNVHLLLPGGEWWQVPCGQTNQNNRLPFSFFFFPPQERNLYSSMPRRLGLPQFLFCMFSQPWKSATSSEPQHSTSVSHSKSRNTLRTPELSKRSTPSSAYLLSNSK